MIRRAEDLARFAQTAEPGQRDTYGRGDHPPADLVRAMAPLIDAKVLVPVRKREGRGFLFLVQRGSGTMPKMRRRRVVKRGGRGVPKTSLTQVFECLVRAARRGEPCPTNSELAEYCELTGKLQASYRMRMLVKQNKITVEDRSPFGRRIVTITHGPWAGKHTSEAAIGGMK